MVPLQRTAFAVSPKHLGVALVPILLLALSSGCGHKRSAMRPVYVGAPVVTPSSSPCDPGTPGCPGGSVSAPAPAFSQPGDLPSGSAPTKSDEEPNLSPATPGLNNGASPPPDRPIGRIQSSPRAAGISRRSDGRAVVAKFVSDPEELFLPPKADRPWRYIVLHHSESETGSYAQIDRDHRENLGTQGCGYHFVVGNGSESKDGLIEVARRWSDQKGGAHCRDSNIPDANDYGIGICLIGNMDKSPPSAKQVQATKALVAYLADRYSIPPSNIVTHAAIAQTPTTCPGSKFPLELISISRGFASR